MNLLWYILLSSIFLIVSVNCTPGLEKYAEQYDTEQGNDQGLSLDSSFDPFSENVESRMLYQSNDGFQSRSLFPSGNGNFQYTTSSPPVPPDGMCEVPTKDIAWNKLNPPMGNGSTILLSKICCPGYVPYKYNSSICIPECKGGCKNAYCSAPNTCRCYQDYVQDLNGECTPTCPLGCLNGKCHANGTCFCNPGYIYNYPKQDYCVPHCPSGCGPNKNCTAPNFCSCSKGYAISTQYGQCEPVCSPPCGVGGVCSAPGICQCNRGFILKAGTCQANCTRGCENGRCVSNEVCICDNGWLLNNDRNKCSPICSTSCIGGFCSAPNVCTCSNGYTNVGKKCEPVCSRGCKFGTCVGPEVCNCPNDRQFDSTGGICRKKRKGNIGRVIADAISNASRDTPAQPKFNPPLQAAPVYHTNAPPKFNPPLHAQPNYPTQQPYNPIFAGHSRPLQGNQIDKMNSKAKPNCYPSCLNGNCTSPNHCTCNYGYRLEKGTTHKCVAECYPSCLNGNCTSPNHCTCNYGYRLESGTTHKCVAQCYPSCLNGSCTSPNHCTCNYGYRLESGTTHKCVAQCSSGCPNGTCTHPETCTCNLGFRKINGVCYRM